MRMLVIDEGDPSGNAAERRCPTGEEEKLVSRFDPGA